VVMEHGRVAGWDASRPARDQPGPQALGWRGESQPTAHSRQPTARRRRGARQTGREHCEEDSCACGCRAHRGCGSAPLGIQPLSIPSTPPVVEVATTTTASVTTRNPRHNDHRTAHDDHHDDGALPGADDHRTGRSTRSKSRRRWRVRPPLWNLVTTSTAPTGSSMVRVTSGSFGARWAGDSAAPSFLRPTASAISTQWIRSGCCGNPHWEGDSARRGAGR
jgi:hypothetical protein